MCTFGLSGCRVDLRRLAPRAEVTGESLAHPLVLQEEGSQASESSVCGEALHNFQGRNFVQSQFWARGHERCCSSWLCRDLPVLLCDISFHEHAHA